ncbi:MAG: hypothetical protein R2827_07920 [Bdellovibrionales bacterium]
MYFSGKISNSVLTYLDHRGVNLEGLYELTELPVEFLRDPACWLEADKLDNFLRTMDQSFGLRLNEGLVETVGLRGNELRSWGVLDSVIKMMETERDIYSQPQRLLSYFVSPEPPIANLKLSENSVQFDLPISSEEYPYVVEYLKSALEGLPKYIGRSAASVRWVDNHIEINWSFDQPTLLNKESLQKSLSPELLQNMVASLENLQTQLEKKNEELKFKDKEISRLKSDVQNLLRTPVNRAFIPDVGEAVVGREEIKFSVVTLRNEISRLSDYISRSQQLVTLLIGRGRLDSQAKTAMRRVGWDQVLQGRILSVRSSLALLEKIENNLGDSTQDEVSEAKLENSFNL